MGENMNQKNVTKTILFLIALMMVVDLIWVYTFQTAKVDVLVTIVLSALDFAILINLIRYYTLRQKPSFVGILLYLISSFLMVLMFARLFMESGIEGQDGYLYTDFGSCFYFSIITWTSLGYGDVRPTLESRSWVMLEVTFGYIHMGVLVGLILDFLKLTRR